MSILRDRSGVLRLGGVDLHEVVRAAGTPAYVYDLDAMSAAARELGAAFDAQRHLVAYAVKANSAGAVVRALAAAGCGADVVSGAELLVALRCGIEPERIVFSGVAKTDDELDRAIGSGPTGIGALQIESVEEVARVEARSLAVGRVARVSLRINPSVDLKGVTHANIATGHDEAKFGIAREDVGRAIASVRESSHMKLVGLATHAGSQFTTTAPYLASARVLFALARDLFGEGRMGDLAFLDAGGGFGIDYGTPSESTAASMHPALPRPADFVRVVREEQHNAGLDELDLYVEPGRSLVAPHGVLLARVIQSKVTSAARWLMIDAGMNDLLRPALYQAWHRIVPLEHDVDAAAALSWRVVGPVCESSDDFGRHPFATEPPRAVAILDAGAYGYTMASEYNGRQLPVEVFVAGGRIIGRTPRRRSEVWVEERVNAGR